MLKKLFKGLLWSMILTLGCILIFAFIIKQANLSDAVIKPVVLAIKVVCILIGVGITIGNTTGRGWLWGAVVGILYTVFAFCIFSAIDGSFTVDLSSLNDLVFSIIIGIFSAMIFRGRTKNIEV
jgi:putative membrane protein (TIGR04086 family)